ncbi:MAG: hypothetical protein ACLVJ6_01025 [Merdibacter sp.]
MENMKTKALAMGLHDERSCSVRWRCVTSIRAGERRCAFSLNETAPALR